MAKHIKTTSAHSQTGTVRYMDGSALKRPLDLPMKNQPIIIGIIVIAVVIGAIMGYRVFDNVVNAQSRQQATVSQTINRGVTLDVPVISGYVGLDNATITQTLTAAGYTTVDMNALSTSGQASGSLDVVKLPSDMTAADAAIAYTKGVSSLSATEAAKYLSGSWRLMVDRSEGMDIKVKYADFKSGSAEAAIQSAMTTEGWTGSTLGDSGIDSSGNTYQQGTISIAGTTYNWSVSVCDLSAVYSVDGLPANAQYVGIRLVQ